MPGRGQRYRLARGKLIQRVLLKKTACHVYYFHDRARDLLEITRSGAPIANAARTCSEPRPVGSCRARAIGPVPPTTTALIGTRRGLDPDVRELAVLRALRDRRSRFVAASQLHRRLTCAQRGTTFTSPTMRCTSSASPSSRSASRCSRAGCGCACAGAIRRGDRRPPRGPADVDLDSPRSAPLRICASGCRGPQRSCWTGHLGVWHQRELDQQDSLAIERGGDSITCRN